ncbi:MAG TPA: glycosyltransferase [Gemmatimonadaceae bacterium]|jgi:cellulose synthase/poly-beta-1,6-N-acetylglucosamine synthase-like glycosyltransferase
MMMPVFWGAAGLWAYSYAGYPAALWLCARARRPRPASAPTGTLPFITITIPVYNEAAVIAATLEAVLDIDYPADRRQIVVISDASTDDTDKIVREFAPRGVELARMPERRGKTAAENEFRKALRGDIIINTDASVRIHRSALRELVAALADQSVGVASARDVSVARVAAGANPGESAYVGYEMEVRALETRIGGIVGASGCLYAIRAELHREYLPDALSRDFAAALIARLHGYRAVSVPGAICFVPRGASLRQEYRRKVRTMTRGLATLFHHRVLLNPFRYGTFAWMLASHKLCRWLLPWASVAMVASVAVNAGDSMLARLLLAGAGVAALAAAAGWFWPRADRMPRAIALPAFAVAGIVAGLHAWLRALSGRKAATWEPTRRDAVQLAENSH